MNTEQIFQELGLNPIMAVTLMENLDLTAEHLNDPYVFNKLQTVIDFLKDYPEDTQRFLLRKATFGKQDKLKVFHEYTHLLKEKKYREEVAEKLKTEKSAVEATNDPFKIAEIDVKEKENLSKIQSLREEIEIYHK